MPLILGTNSIKDTGYDVANSVRLNSGDSPNFTRTPGSASNRRTWTWSGWVKRSGLGSIQTLFNGSDGSYPEIFYFAADDTFIYHHDISGSDYKLISSQVFRDVSAWYHIIVAKDTTQSTETNRLKVYVNGSQITMNESALGYPTQNYQGAINIDDVHIIGNWKTNSYYIDGYLAEIAFIDGSQLDATSFGEFNSDSPTIWQPIDISGLTFGTNGFYLDFEDSSDLGKDVSGNGNDYTANNLAATDQSTDTCTNNFATLNPLANLTGSPTYSEGNLKVTGDSSANNNWQTTFVVSSGKWYWELKDLTSSPDGSLLFYDQSISSGSHPGYGFVLNTKKKVINGSPTGSAIGSSAQNDIWSMALDLDNGKMFIARNGTYLSSGDPANGTNPFIQTSDGLPSEGVFGGHIYNGSMELNFGSPSFSISSGNTDDNGYGNFEYDVPAGFYSLNTKNLAEFG